VEQQFFRLRPDELLVSPHVKHSGSIAGLKARLRPGEGLLEDRASRYSFYVGPAQCDFILPLDVQLETQFRSGLVYQSYGRAGIVRDRLQKALTTVSVGAVAG